VTAILLTLILSPSLQLPIKDYRSEILQPRRSNPRRTFW
jgi:hypothetical protein